jgi:hypothetical protein
MLTLVDIACLPLDGVVLSAPPAGGPELELAEALVHTSDDNGPVEYAG